MERVSDIGRWDWDLATGELHCPVEVERTLGLSPGQLQLSPRAWITRVNADDRADVSEALVAALTSGRDAALEYRAVWPDGSLHWISHLLTVWRDPQGHPLHLSGVVQDITARRCNDKALRTSVSYYYTLFESSLDGLAIVGPDLKFRRVNAAFCELVEFEPEELIGQRSIADLTHPDDADASRQLLELQMEQHGGRSIADRRYITRSGRVVEAITSIAAVFDDAGRYLGSTASFVDITERKRAEAALRDSEYRYAMAQRAADIGSWVMTFDTGVIQVSERIEPMFGLQPGQFDGTYDTFLAAVHTEDRKRVADAVKASLRGAQEYKIEYRIVWPDGTVRWIAAAGEVDRDESGAPQRMFGVVQDITERKQIVEELERSKTTLAEAQRLAHVGSFDWNPITDELAWSDEHFRLWSYEPGQVKPSYQVFLAALHPDDVAEVEAALQSAFAGGGHYDCEHRVRWPDGSVHYMHGRGEVTFEHGAPVRMLGTVTDITERKQAENLLKESARHKDEFLAMLGHELRNPLASIRNANQILKTIGSTDLRARQAQRMVERQNAHLARIVDDLLDLSRISRGKIVLHKELLDWAQLVGSSIEDWRAEATARGVTLDLELPREPVWVHGDPTRLSQITGNLLGNALKFTEPGGRVLVEVLCDAATAQGALVVRDTGVGMASDTIEHIFEPFVQADVDFARSRGGLGMGLALVKSLAQLHGGTVCAESRGRGQGSELTVTLPLVAAPVAQPTRPAPRRASERLTILLVEDNRDAAESMRLVLELMGHIVQTARDGCDGIDQARRLRPDVILCDIGLPGDVDGYAVARVLRADPTLRSTFLAAMTGFGLAEDKRRAREAGFDLHLTKPVDPASLQSLLASLPRRGRDSSATREAVQLGGGEPAHPA